LGAAAFKYRSFDAPPAAIPPSRLAPSAAIQMPAFDPIGSGATVSAASVYKLLGTALPEARQVQVERVAPPSPVAAPPSPSDPTPTPASLAQRALRAQAATPRAREDRPPRTAPAPAAPPAAIAAAPWMPPAPPPPGSAPSRVSVPTPAPQGGRPGAAPLAGLFQLLAEPRTAPGAPARPGRRPPLP
jgi:hypothetical protein